MAATRIAVIDDDQAVLQMTVDVLAVGGYEAEPYSDPEKALRSLRTRPADLVLLDVNLGATTGTEVCRLVRADPALCAMPVILVTGDRVEEADQVLGFSVGADDYVLKPWTIDVLLARVGAVLRRSHGLPTGHILQHGPLVLDPARREGRLEGRPLGLTPTEFRILARLVAHPDRAWPRAELLDDDDGSTTGRHVDVHVLSIRKKLGRWRELVQTAYRVGYRIGAPESPLLPQAAVAPAQRMPSTPA